MDQQRLQIVFHQQKVISRQYVVLHIIQQPTIQHRTAQFLNLDVLGYLNKWGYFIHIKIPTQLGVFEYVLLGD
jgi:hypothetical protein